jgi:hypothetical protein
VSAPAVGDRVSFSYGIRMADGVVRVAGSVMVAIEPDDPSKHDDLDAQGRLWRYPHELAPIGGRPPADLVATACPHGEPHPSACPECVDTTPVPAEREEPERASGHSFGARWPGQCPGCNLPITPGQSVQRTNRKRYFHERCTP